MNRSTDSTETNRLLKRASQGDRPAVEALLESYEPYLRRLVELRLASALRGRIDPSDVVQETHLAVSRQLEEFSQERQVSFKLWLRRLALDQLAQIHRDHLKTLKRAVGREVQLSDQSSLALAKNFLQGRPSRIVARRELVEGVRRVIGELSENDREVLLMRHFEELSNVEIAQLLGIEPAAVSQRYGRAVRRFCQKLEEQGMSGQA